jgi:hypothetical protein
MDPVRDQLPPIAASAVVPIGKFTERAVRQWSSPTPRSCRAITVVSLKRIGLLYGARACSTVASAVPPPSAQRLAPLVLSRANRLIKMSLSAG